MSEMSMRERVARAICRQHNLDEGFSEEQVDSPMWRELDANYLKCADAALDAMREPTSGMLADAKSTLNLHALRPNYAYDSHEMAIDVWIAMIDAAKAGA